MARSDRTKTPRHRCEEHEVIVHDATSSWRGCRLCGKKRDVIHYDRPKVAERARERCRAKEIASDGPVPYVERCIYVRKHDGRHECSHGFHWGGAHD